MTYIYVVRTYNYHLTNASSERTHTFFIFHKQQFCIVWNYAFTNN